MAWDGLQQRKRSWRKRSAINPFSSNGQPLATRWPGDSQGQIALTTILTTARMNWRDTERSPMRHELKKFQPCILRRHAATGRHGFRLSPSPPNRSVVKPSRALKFRTLTLLYVAL